jgi:predicted transcriptional regulator
MADGGLTIELQAGLAERLKEAARAAGRSTDDFASELIAQGLADDWTEARASLAEYDRSGEFVDAKEALAAARTRLLERLDRAR